MQFFITCLVSLLLVTSSLAATISSTPLISGNLVDADKFPISRAGSGVAYTGDVGKLKNTIRPNEVVVGVDAHALTLVAANTDSDNSGKTIVLNSPATLAVNLTLATDRVWRFEKGAVITTTGYTFNTNAAPVEIGDYQVFAGTGTVTGLKEARPEWFGGAGDDSTDNTASFKQAAASGAKKIILQPGGIYRITAPIGGSVATVTGSQGFSLIGTGAVIKDMQTYTGTQSAAFITFTASNNIYIDPQLKFTSQASDNVNQRGLDWFTFLQGCDGVTGGGEFVGGLHAFYPTRSSIDPTSYISKRFDLKIKATSVYYPFVAERSGDFSRLDIVTVGCGRSWFAYGGGSNSEVKISSKNQTGATMISSDSGGTGVENVILDFYDRESDSNTPTNYRTALQFYNQTPTVMRNIKIHLNIKNPTASPWGQSFMITKLDNAGSADTVGRGHVLDGFELTGVSEQVDGKDHIGMIGAFASTDKIYNFRIKDFHALGVSAGSSRIVLNGFGDALQDIVKIEDLYMPVGVMSIVHSTGRTVYSRCTALSLNDSTADTSNQDFISCNISQGTLQSKINKTFVNTNIGTINKGVPNGASLNTGSMANLDVFSLSLYGIVNHQGILIITKGGGTIGMFNLRGANHAVQELMDPSNVFSVTAGTVGTNIYWSAANSRYELENKTGGTEAAGYELTYFTRMD